MKKLLFSGFLLILLLGCADVIKFREDTITKHGNGKAKLIHRFKKVNGGKYKLIQKKHFNSGGFLTRFEDLEHNRVKIALIDSKGHCKAKQEYVNGLKSGMWITWNSGGWVERKAMYKKGRLHGKVRVFNKKGELVSSAEYENGRKIK